jgi:DNA-binding NarL/FixJ family response regulator
MTLRVVVADDQALVRVGFCGIIAATPGYAVVGEAGNGAEAVEEARRARPDVILMDVRMPVMDGIEATRRITASTDVRTLILTTFDLDEYVFAALRAGASGFLLKHTPPAEILRAISRVAAGEPILSPTVTRQLIAHLSDTGAAARQRHATTALDQLSEREREVAIAVGRGKSNAEIAGELFMSVATVKAHISRILTKLDLNNRTQVALLAHDAGLTG